MGTNRSKAVKDRKKHREKVIRWHERNAKRQAKKVADRLIGRTLGIDRADGVSDRTAYTFKFHNSRPGLST